MPTEADMTTGAPQRDTATPTVVLGTVPLVTTGAIRPATPTGHPVAAGPPWTAYATAIATVRPAYVTPGDGFTPSPPPVPWAAPTADHPICTRRAGPRGTSRQFLGVCGWATALGLIGLATGLRGLVAIVAGVAPDWYEPMIAGVGLGGVALTMVAFLSIRHPRLPWIMLSLATLPLAVNLAVTLAAL
ncbi:hypothetical protein OG792_05370 [Micromonospora sp. NBC_01699]|uniref:hypothetical protein n=1 Tax=Micromonospora sp. NBC_01699 TaxID=2975984 RepID=UPI002E30AA33|nr:hypothetical protein [Micromonospora sp. NBC_01699]